MNTVKPLRADLLGEFSLRAEATGQALTDQDTHAKKVIVLLTYLLLHRQREVTQQELIDALWPNAGSDDPPNALKTLLHRVRSLVALLGYDGRELIRFRSGTYAWNSQYPVVLDVEEFEALSRLDAETEEARLAQAQAAIALYKGDFLSRFSAEPWVSALNARYHARYLQVVRFAAGVLSRMGRHEEIIRLCRNAIDLDPYDEGLHLALLRALADSDRKQEALQYYRHVADLFMHSFGIRVSPLLSDFYQQLTKVVNAAESDLSVIRQKLDREAADPRAFSCEYETFRRIYQMAAQAAARTGLAVQLVLISLEGDPARTQTQKQIGIAMERTAELMADTLRPGDVFTRFSFSQYLCLFPAISLEDSEARLQLLRRSFRKKYSHMNIQLRCSVLPVTCDFPTPPGDPGMR